MRTLVLSLLALCCLRTVGRADEPIQPAPTIVGRWWGVARFASADVVDKRFSVRLFIHHDGTVTGTVGDARLLNARFMLHRPTDRPDLTTWSKYMIAADLLGPMMASEKISAAKVFIPLESYRGKLSGGVNLHGSSINGVPADILGADLTLQRQPTSKHPHKTNT